MPTSKFYFGRLNFKHQLARLDDYDEDLSRTERIKRNLHGYLESEGPVYEQKDGTEEWYFGTIVERDGLIYGNFGKVYVDRPTTYDFDTGEFIEGDEEQPQADAARFLIYPEKNLIIYNTKQHIGYLQFREAFAEGYSDYVGVNDALSIGLLQEKSDIEEILGESRVFYADLDVVPTNPTTDRDMAKLDDHIQAMEADEVSIEAKADNEIDMDEDLMSGGVAMVANGYGEMTIEYERDGREEEYSSDQRPASHEVDRPDDLTDLQAIADELIERARNLLGNDGE